MQNVFKEEERINYKQMHDGEQSRKVATGKAGKKVRSVVQKVHFEEDGNLIEMEAEGMDTEFLGGLSLHLNHLIA